MNRLKSGPCAIFRTNLIIVAPYNLPVRSRSSSGPCQCVLGLSRSHLLSLQTLMCYFDTEVNFIAQSSPVSSLLTRTFHGDSRSTYQGLAKGPLYAKHRPVRATARPTYAQRRRLQQTRSSEFGGLVASRTSKQTLCTVNCGEQ